MIAYDCSFGDSTTTCYCAPCPGGAADQSEASVIRNRYREGVCAAVCNGYATAPRRLYPSKALSKAEVCRVLPPALLDMCEVVGIDAEAGNVIVRWDGLDARTITCRIPTDEAGAVLPPADFKADIMAQCVRSLEHWDKLAQADVVEARKYVGQAFDVTEEYVLRNIKE